MSERSTEKFLAFLIPYIGQWPRWMRLFLASCARNPHVHFLFLSENPPGDDLPANVFHHNMSTQDMQERFDGALGMSLPAIEGRKLPDYRPFYALAFADYLAGYEFFGQCDIDLVFGDLSWSLNPSRLEGVDVFSPHDRYVVGHCTAFRNDERIWHLGREVLDYRERSLVPVSTHMDESGITRVLSRRPDINYVHPRSLAEQIEKSRAEIGVTAHTSTRLTGLGPFPGYQYEWTQGRGVLDLANGLRPEIMYFHFMALKRRPFWLSYSSEKEYDSFAFTGAGFRPAAMSRWKRRIVLGPKCRLIDGMRKIKNWGKPAKGYAADGFG